MKIQDVNHQAQIIQYVNQQAKLSPTEKNPVSPDRSPSAAPVSGDRVDLSPSSRMIQKIQEAALAAPDVRTEKTAALKKQIENGTYSINSEEIAGKMIKEFLLELNK